MKQPIEKIVEKDRVFGDRYTHPSWAKVQISRVTGSIDLYGSEVRQESHFRLKISPSEMSVRHGAKHYFASHQSYIEVALSASQFIEMLTTLNFSEGTCATLLYKDRKAIPQVEEKEATATSIAKEGFINSLDGKLKDIESQIQKIKTIFKSKKPLKVKEKEEVLFLMECIEGHFRSNSKFYLDQFKEASDKVTQEAKSEVENFLNTIVIEKGLKQLKKEALQLGEGE